MAMEGNYSLSDIAAITDGGMNGGASAWWMIILFAMIFGWGGNGWGNNNGFANAIGYENLATSNEVQRGFDNQNSVANQRDILAAVNAGAAQGVATTNQVFHDTLNAMQNDYNELQRDISGVAIQQQQLLANQNDCCCSTKMLISETAAQQRYDSAMQTASINENTTAQIQKVLDVVAQNKIDALQQQVNGLQLQQAVAGVVRYPDSFTYSAGANPFCGFGNSCNI